MIQSRWSKVLGILPLVGAVAAFSACNGQGGQTEETGVTSPQLQGAAAVKEDAHRHHGHARGPERLLFVALHELDLTDAQQTAIKGEIEALHQARSGDRPDMAAHRTALAAAIRSGKVDAASIPAPAAMAPRDPARLARAMATLHDTLTPAQRKQLVDVVSAKMDKVFDHEGPKGKMHGPLAHMLHGLSLTDAQRAKVREAVKDLAPSAEDREAMKARGEAFKATVRDRLATFAADGFDANAFVAMPKDMPAADAMHDRMVKALAAIVPILDEAQRAELAKRIEQGPAVHEDAADEVEP